MGIDVVFRRKRNVELGVISVEMIRYDGILKKIRERSSVRGEE
jgi:hypothetical protein